MFRLIKQEFIALLSFGGSLTTKCWSLNDKPCMIRPTLIDLNPVECNYYLFRINVDKCDEVVMLSMTYLRNYVFLIKQKKQMLKYLI